MAFLERKKNETNRLRVFHETARKQCLHEYAMLIEYAYVAVYMFATYFSANMRISVFHNVLSHPLLSYLNSVFLIGKRSYQWKK